jgi:glucosamine--fructose-6-phosphate aminotransferase (isomerizing)
MEQGQYTFEEIITQPVAWSEALAVSYGSANGLMNLANSSYEQVLFTGCGSTYYLSLAGAAAFQEFTGQAARGVPASELLLNPQVVFTEKRTLLIAISRSGTTTETLRAVEKFRDEKRGSVVVISNYDSPLSHLGDVSLVIPAGQEESVAQTRSFASMYVAAIGVSALLAGRMDILDTMSHLPRVGENLLNVYQPLAKEIGQNLDYDRFYFLGSGMRYGLACEVNLKMKEMTLTHSEAFHFLEFRHGPMSMISPTAMVVGLLSEMNNQHEWRVLHEMQALGGKILSVSDRGGDVEFKSGIPEQGRGVLYLPVLQLMAYYRSLAKGLNPDRPNNLSAVVTLQL